MAIAGHVSCRMLEGTAMCAWERSEQRRKSWRQAPELPCHGISKIVSCWRQRL